MHIECEKGPAHNPRVDRARSRRPGRPSPDPRQRQDSASGDITLEHVLVAAKRRRAPITVEAAGYLTLAVADALVAAPAIVLPIHVFITSDGEVMLRGARGRGDDKASEQSVRALLATLLRVAVGSSPALVAAANRTSQGGVGGVIEEVEAALIPVNRSAARRAIGRLAREVERAQVELPARKPAPPRAEEPERKLSPRPRASGPVVQRPATTASEPAPAAVEPSRAPTPVPVAPAPAEVVEAVLAAPEPTPVEPVADPVAVCDEATDIDAPVSLVQPPVVETPWKAVASAPREEPVPAPSHATPHLATYDPRNASLSHEQPARVELADAFADDEEYDDLLTYEPPDALGDESLDFGTASPPDVGLSFPGDEAPTMEQPTGEWRDDAPDRVDELIAGFDGEPKNMLELAATPEPPASADDPDPERAPDPPQNPKSAPLPPVEYARPRNPKLGLALSFGLLVLAIAGMVVLYTLYPALLLGH